jgi:putative spermidine/putrescine transport system permease protein
MSTKGEEQSRWSLGEWLFLILVGCIYAFLTVPSLLTIPISFSGTQTLTFPPSTFSLDLYRRFFASPVWTGSLVESLAVGAATACVATYIGALGAYGLARGNFAGKRLIGAILMSPILVPSIVIALGLYFYFSQLRLIGTTGGLVLAHSILTIPYVIVVVLAGLRQLDQNVETAAAIMGANPLRIFTRVVVPQIYGSLGSAFLFAFLISFDEVVISWFIAGTNATTLPVVMYGSLKVEVAPEIAAAATMLSATSLLIIFLYMMFQKPDRAE